MIEVRGDRAIHGHAPDAWWINPAEVVSVAVMRHLDRRMLPPHELFLVTITLPTAAYEITMDRTDLEHLACVLKLPFSSGGLTTAAIDRLPTEVRGVDADAGPRCHTAG